MGARSWPRLVVAVQLFISVTALAGELELRFLDVGQADAVLVRNDGKTALIDTGSTDGIVARLRALGVETIDLLLITHNHLDHLGGADAVLAALPVRNYLDNGWPAKTKLQEVVLDLVDAKKIPYLEATRRDIALGDAVLHILPPGAAGEQNDRSVGVVLERGRFRAMLPGDAEVTALHGWVAAGMVPAVSVLKASHHGSRNGVTPLWIKTTRPELVVISCGKDNDYGHPHEAALRYYQTSGRRILRTDEVGDVSIRVQPDGAWAVATAVATAAAPTPTVAREDRAPAPAACCRVCAKGRACGDICIPKEHRCSKPKGCACDG